MVLAADLAVAAQGGENVSMSKVLRGGGELGGGRDTLKTRHSDDYVRFKVIFMELRMLQAYAALRVFYPVKGSFNALHAGAQVIG